MKIRILTFSSASNYGALLQTYALCKVLQDAGHQIELYKISLFKPSIRSFIRKHFYARFVKQFQREYLPPFVEIRAKADADCCIVGSDQVWNPIYFSSLGFKFFFDFLPDNCKRIAYAASFGKDDWKCPADRKEYLISLLNKFSHISLRESMAIPRFSQMFGITPELVLDPTLLLTDYTYISGKIQQQNTLASFKFNQSEAYYELLGYVSAELNLKLLRLDARYVRCKGHEYINRYCSVSNWVRGIAQSRFVVTDSFHGMVFAIIYRKQFIVFGASHTRNGRILSLLKLLGLEKRYYLSCDKVLKEEPWKEEIDYTAVNNKLNHLRVASLHFLMASITS